MISLLRWSSAPRACDPRTRAGARAGSQLQAFGWRGAVGYARHTINGTPRGRRLARRAAQGGTARNDGSSRVAQFDPRLEPSLLISQREANVTAPARPQQAAVASQNPGADGPPRRRQRLLRAPAPRVIGVAQERGKRINLQSRYVGRGQARGRGKNLDSKLQTQTASPQAVLARVRRGTLANARGRLAVAIGELPDCLLVVDVTTRACPIPESREMA